MLFSSLVNCSWPSKINLKNVSKVEDNIINYAKVTNTDYVKVTNNNTSQKTMIAENQDLEKDSIKIEKKE